MMERVWQAKVHSVFHLVFTYTVGLVYTIGEAKITSDSQF